MNTCFVCEKNLGNTYSLRLKKEGNYFHTCSYNCNCKMEDKMGDDYWLYVVNKTDFIIKSSESSLSSIKITFLNLIKQKINDQTW